MSLETNLKNLAQSIGNEMKSLRTMLNGNVADLQALTTADKGTIVGAINEINAAVEAIAEGGGAAIDDGNVSTSTVWSSSKTRSEIDAKSSIDDTKSSTTTTYSSSKTESVATAAAGALINDTTASGTRVYSSTKTEARITAATAQLKTDLLGGAAPAYDTLKELYDLLQAGDSADQAAISDLVTQLGTRVRFDAAQTLTDAQKAQARTNIGAVSADDVGDTSANFVTVFQDAYNGAAIAN